jgi:hypothetical protein
MARHLFRYAVALVLLAAGTLDVTAGAETSEAGSGPSVTFSCTPAPDDCTGWYRSDVGVHWTVDSSAINTDGCNTRTVTTDTQGVVMHCDAENSSGQWTRVEITIKVDKTAPQITGAIPDRGPDAAGWYNHPLTISFQGSDATSGISACTSITYSGPDSAAGSVTGSCSDRAGNTSAPVAFNLKYDTTPPTLKIDATVADRAVMLRWRASPDTKLVTISRTVGRATKASAIYRGPGRSFRDKRLRNGVQYHYTLTAFDEANNAAAKTVGVTPLGALFSPYPSARVSAPPLLRWRAVSRATYYNVQLIRGRKILSAWPTRPRLQLRRSWTYGGRRYRLAPGRYRWYVWPGFGSPAATRYGPLLGQSEFVVTG